MINKIFKPLIGRTMEVYVEYLEETFGLLRKYKMKLNLEKCAFGVESGKFLRFIVSHRGIEANSEKISAKAFFK